VSLDTLHQKQLPPTDQGQLQQTAVVLICKSSLVRAGIRHILDGTPFIVAADLEDSSELPAVPDASPALYILDESHAADALAEIVAGLKAQCPSARVVVLADNLDPETTVRAFQVGINGLCSTRMGHDALIKALELVMLGETFIQSALVSTALNRLPQAHESQSHMTLALTPANEGATRTHNLSSREVEILEHLMQGESNKVIARSLNIAEATIKVHIKAILRKVHAANRTQAALWATTHLFVDDEIQHGSHSL
jgi:two-component system nitrate/nitrite response regulator NarL